MSVAEDLSDGVSEGSAAASKSIRSAAEAITARGGRRRNKRGGRGGNKAPEMVRRQDGITTRTTQGQPMAPASSTSSASALSGVPASGATPRGKATHARLFRLPTGKQARLPDAHLPYEFQRSRKEWETVELYDAWRHGAVLSNGSGCAPCDESDSSDGECGLALAIRARRVDAATAQKRARAAAARRDQEAQADLVYGPTPECIVDNPFEPQTDAERVTMLLHRVSRAPGSRRPQPVPEFVNTDPGVVDTSRPCCEQLAKFPALGWGSEPPTALALVQRMVAITKADFEYDKQVNGSFNGRRKVYAYSHKAWVHDPDGYRRYPDNCRPVKGGRDDIDDFDGADTTDDDSDDTGAGDFR